MSAVIQLLATLRERKIEPIYCDGRLKLRGPASRTTPDLLGSSATTNLSC